MKTSSRWYPAACNCNSCRQIGWRAPTWAATIKTQQGLTEIVVGEPNGLRLVRDIAKARR